MLALCLMLLVTYYAFNYAGIIGRGLISGYNPVPLLQLLDPIQPAPVHI